MTIKESTIDQTINKIVVASPGMGKTFFAFRNKLVKECEPVAMTDSELLNELTSGSLRVVDLTAQVISVLTSNKIPFILVYPNANDIESFAKRYSESKYSIDRVAQICEEWGKTIEFCKNVNGCTHVPLDYGMYLSNHVYVEYPGHFKAVGKNVFFK